MVTIAEFKKIMGDYYQQHKRSFAWRETNNPYHIFVSEVMLQQTQTHRVAAKYAQFIATFPTIQSLALSSTADILAVWQGLGYNRRALFLKKAAELIVTKYEGIIPSTPDTLILLPGIGKATAASITAFAFNKPTIFIETNIRTVFIHTFFAGQDCITDAQLMPLISAAVDHHNPREWYYALMDYGVMLKKKIINPSRASAHYTKQSPFKGSERAVRGFIIRHLLECKTISRTLLIEDIVSHFTYMDQKKAGLIINKLINENFCVEKNYTLYV